MSPILYLTRYMTIAAKKQGAVSAAPVFGDSSRNEARQYNAAMSRQESWRWVPLEGMPSGAAGRALPGQAEREADYKGVR